MTTALTESQRTVARKFVSYVFGDMAALWASKGWNTAGQHGIERLRTDLTPVALGYRRSMVVGRQLFFFSQAWHVTGTPLYADRAHALFADLTGRFWDAEHGGWFFSLGDDHAPANAGKDLYGHALVLFGLAHYATVFQQPAALDWARRTHVLIQRHLRLPQGWLAQAAARDWRVTDQALEQNPHMHLLEAYLALHAASGDPDFLQEAARIVALFAKHLRSPNGAQVIEHLDADGRPRQDIGHLVQPGHSYEWYWLLNEYVDSSGQQDGKILAAPLFDWANRHGVDGLHGGIYDQLDTQGHVFSDRKRIWPVTECIKAHATLAAQGGDAETCAALTRWITFLDRTYLTGQGGWHEYLRRDLQPDSDYLPASTPYHIAMAALKVEGLLGERETRKLTMMP